LCVEMRREAGSSLGSLSSLRDPSSLTEHCQELCLQWLLLHLNLTTWNKDAFNQAVSCHFTCSSQLPT
jgi:hypothetical protein